MSVNSLIASIQENMTVFNNHWVRTTETESFPKYVKYDLGKIPVFKDCKLHLSNRNKFGVMKIIMRNKITEEGCEYTLLLRNSEAENIYVSTMLSELSTILTTYDDLYKTNEANLAKIVTLEAKVEELEQYQVQEEEVV